MSVCSNVSGELRMKICAEEGKIRRALCACTREANPTILRWDKTPLDFKTSVNSFPSG